MADNQKYVIKICSFNCGGINRGGHFISDLLKLQCIDIVLLQETWLLNSNLLDLADIHDDYLFGGKSGVDSTSGILSGRPHGGVAILWNKSLSHQVEVIDIGNKRLFAIKIKLDTNETLLMINVYMPCDNRSKSVVNEDYQTVIDDIEHVLLSLDYDSAIIYGDFNTCLNRNNAHSLLLTQFTVRNVLYNVWNHPKAKQDDTYINTALNQRSRIDHAYVTENLLPCIQQFSVYHSPLNPSDHVPLVLQLQININRIHKHEYSQSSAENISWCRVTNAHINKYKYELDKYLTSDTFDTACIDCNNKICESETHRRNIDHLFAKLVSSCIQAGNASFPKCKSKHQTVPYWSEEVKPLRESSLFWHAILKDNGSPRSGPVADVMRATRVKYHKAVKDLKQQENELRKSRFAENHKDKNPTQFWHEVKKMSRSKRVSPTSIDGKYDDMEICKLFHEKYKILYDSVPSSKNELNDIFDKVNDLVATSAVPIVSVKDVYEAISKLKPNKKGGLEGSFSNHFIYASHKFVVLFSLLFQSLLNHGYMPEQLLSSVITPIPKNSKGNLSDLNNYRGIALSCALGKIIDTWIMLKYSSVLKSSDHQFAFKAEHSTSMCTLTLKEIIKYFTNKGSIVYVCLLDASKAFDRLKFSCLFRLLLKKV